MMPDNARENIEMVNANYRRHQPRPMVKQEKTNYIDLLTDLGFGAFMVIALWLIYVLAWACL